MDFDVQHRPSSFGKDPKDLLRIQRDKKNLAKTKNKMMETISIDDEAHTPSHEWSWNSFLANRENKANLVIYLSHKMLESNDLLAADKKLYVSFEGGSHIVTLSTTTKFSSKATTKRQRHMNLLVDNIDPRERPCKKYRYRYPSNSSH